MDEYRCIGSVDEEGESHYEPGDCCCCHFAYFPSRTRSDVGVADERRTEPEHYPFRPVDAMPQADGSDAVKSCVRLCKVWRQERADYAHPATSLDSRKED